MYKGNLSRHKGSVIVSFVSDIQKCLMCCVVILFCFFREDQVNFRGFMRTLAHFRPIEDNEKNKNAAASEPLNSRTNKLLCECRARSHGRVRGGGAGDHYHGQSQDFMKCAYCDLYIYFYISSCFPPVWPGQRWQNLSGWAAAGEWIGSSCK